MRDTLYNRSLILKAHMRKQAGIGDFINDNAGAIIGGLGGFGGGAMLGSSMLDDDTLTPEERSRLKVKGGLLGGLTGGLLGGLGGHFVQNGFGVTPAAAPVAAPVEKPEPAPVAEAKKEIVSKPAESQEASSKPATAPKVAKPAREYDPDELRTMADRQRRDEEAKDIAYTLSKNEAARKQRAAAQRDRDLAERREFDENLRDWLITDNVTGVDMDKYNNFADLWYKLNSSDKGLETRDRIMDTTTGLLNKVVPYADADVRYGMLDDALRGAAGITLEKESNVKQAGIGEFISDNAGAIIGALGGMGVGGITGSEIADDPGKEDSERTNARLTGGIIGALLGGGIGGVGGHYLHGALANIDNGSGEPVSGNQGGNVKKKVDSAEDKTTETVASGPSLYDTAMDTARGAKNWLANAFTFDHPKEDKELAGTTAAVTGTAGTAYGLMTGNSAYRSGLKNLYTRYRADNAAATAELNAATTKVNNLSKNISAWERAAKRGVPIDQAKLIAAKDELKVAQAAHTAAQAKQVELLKTLNANKAALTPWLAKTGLNPGAAASITRAIKGGVLGSGIGYGAPYALDMILD